MEAAAPQPASQMSGSVPISLRYNLGVTEAIPAERHSRRFQAENPSVFSESNNVVRIPVTSENFLDLRNAVLGIDLKNTTPTDTQFLDGGASCIIQRLRVLSNSGRELERLEQFNLLSATLDQYAGSMNSQIADDVLKGAPARLDMTPYMPASGVTAASSTTTNGTTVVIAGGGTSIISNSSGGRGYAQDQATQLATGVSRHFEFPLRASGWFNNATGKLLPPRSGFVLELTLAPAVQAFARLSGSATQAYTAQNFALTVPAVAVRDPAFNSAMEARLAQGVSWAATTYQHHVNTSAGAPGRDVIQIAARCLELKGLMTVFRKQSNIGAAGEFQNTRRSIQYIGQYQYQVGSMNYPPHQVDVATSVNPGGVAAGTRMAIPGTADLNISEAYSEVQRLFGNLGAQSGATCLIGAEPYAQSESNNGAGVIGVDLSSFSDGAVMSGVDTRSNALPVALEFLKTAAANSTIQIDTYAVCSAIYTRSPAGELMVSI